MQRTTVLHAQHALLNARQGPATQQDPTLQVAAARAEGASLLARDHTLCSGRSSSAAEQSSQSVPLKLSYIYSHEQVTQQQQPRGGPAARPPTAAPDPTVGVREPRMVHESQDLTKKTWVVWKTGRRFL